ncbi:MAG: hydrogenase maturation protein HypF [Solirubrobacteraceae bacterium]|nr:hydrogenase maturation protein HypF [Solirubrobacteraceae bacterium]
MSATRVRARVEGLVQGVGFRPYVHRLAGELALGGFVRNDERGVLLEVEGDDRAVRAFLARLAVEAPPLASVERVEHEPLAPTGEAAFAIVASAGGAEPVALVSPDSATCDDCLAELFDPADRRHRYPFLSCTNCGPRFTIVLGVPYDRPATTMAGFRMCARCQAEYDDPADRRFHAQPNACAACGPTLRLGAATGEDALGAAVAALRAGQVVAVKGLGGFHLACVADDEAAVLALRARKHREEKPFALMAPDLPAARELVELGPGEEALLIGRERPIVLAPRRPHARVAHAVAPRSADLGVMLPYAPLHHLLLADVGATLVMTSANVSDEPIVHRDDEARTRLAGIADAILGHDRPIGVRTDDSVVRVRRSGPPLVLRRSRGHVPASVDLPLDAPPLLACGAELKSTFCVAKGRRAWVGHHIGDLANLETLTAFREGIAHFEALFAVRPRVVAHDLHPDYLSTAYALEREDVELVAVQHHHAHLAACLAEHGERGPAVGAIYDGTGLGTDGTVWGGELLVGDLAGFERAGHLRPVRLPGGDRAVRQPWRMACAWLQEASGAPPALPATLADAVGPAAWEAIARLAGSGLAAPVTTSMGRLFDAVAALCGVRAEVSYEGQAAAELEGAAARAAAPGDPYPLDVETGDAVVLDPRPTIAAIARDVADGIDAGLVGARFHAAVARATARAVDVVAERHGIATVVLSGGVFQNRLLLDATARRLAERGLRVLVPERLSPNDGAISYGQAAVAAARRPF